ncbi:MAG: 4-(cytidine 5'-diphospho)-2-C-methyl-D-erythritol kinase [candidate division Zixibacteria bacterium]|nr:4-(cytidine 5'-diphospho)-2-C-methyl-D-erythritol kinase [candidate division Zixibacteria bacterium]
MNTIEVKTPAKINLFLKVINRRPDGYHDIHSWFQAVDLYDHLAIEKRAMPGFALFSENGEGMPRDDRNTMIKAAKLMFERFELEGGLDIRIKKNIPISAGLGGGSSDAAATISGISTLYDLNLDPERMAEIGLEIGSDVPFFFSSGQAEVTGRGEIIKPIALPTDYRVVLVTPPVSISTAESYRALKMDLTTRNPGIKLLPCKTFNEMITELIKTGNDFEILHFRALPELARIAGALRQIGAKLTRMSGSGPTMYGLFDTVPDRDDLSKITGGDWRVYHLKPITLPAWD